MMAKIKEWADRNLAKFASRKLIVWATATVLLLADKIDSEHWVWVAAAYMSVEGVADVISRIKGA